jgi:hypothetical protein
VGDAAADGVAVAAADELGDPEPDGDVEPLGAAVAIGVGVGLGDGKRVLGTFAKERAKISTKMAITIVTQSCASLSLRGGREPRYPADGVSVPRSGAERRRSVMLLPSRKPPVRRPGEG